MMDAFTKVLKPGSLLAWGIDGLLWAYVGLLLTWLALRHIGGDRSALVLSLNFLGAWLFLPLPLFAIWALSRRKAHRAVLLVVPTSLFLWFYGPLLTPPTPQADRPANSVTILTFNLRYSNGNVAALLSRIGAAQADLLALQEISPFQQQNLKQAMSSRYPYYWYDVESAMAVYSRYPILTRKNLPMQPWSAQSVVVQVADTPLHLINAHLAPVGVLRYVQTLDADVVRKLTDNREAQVSQIQTAIQDTGLPAVVACDCNMTDLMTAYGQITTTMRDAYRDRGWGLGHTLLVPRGFELGLPFNLPGLRVDYLFYSPEITALEIDIVSGDTGSDHLPLVGHFELKENVLSQTNSKR